MPWNNHKKCYRTVYGSVAFFMIISWHKLPTSDGVTKLWIINRISASSSWRKLFFRYLGNVEFANIPVAGNQFILVITQAIILIQWQIKYYFEARFLLLQMDCICDLTALLWKALFRYSVLRPTTETGRRRSGSQRERERDIKFIGLFGDRGHRGPYSPYKPWNNYLPSHR